MGASVATPLISEGRGEAIPRNDAVARLVSLDAFRGFIMFWIVVAARLSSGFRPSAAAASDTLVYQLNHSTWEGLRFYDCIWPAFMLMVGVSIPFSFAKRSQTQTQGQMFRHALRRFLILFLLGGMRASVQSRFPTHGGAARFNVSNALQAAAACYFAGVAPAAIADGLRSFEMSFEATPGRLNRFDGLPFTVIMDYAHNADGFRQLVGFVDRLPVRSRKILMVGYTGDRRDADILAAVGELAGHFDLYVCRNFQVIRAGRPPHELPELVKRGLREAGVADDRIHVVPDAVESVHYALNLACPGDLVVLLVGSMQFESVWEILRELKESNLQRVRDLPAAT